MLVRDDQVLQTDPALIGAAANQGRPLAAFAIDHRITQSAIAKRGVSSVLSRPPLQQLPPVACVTTIDTAPEVHNDRYRPSSPFFEPSPPATSLATSAIRSSPLDHLTIEPHTGGNPGANPRQGRDVSIFSYPTIIT